MQVPVSQQRYHTVLDYVEVPVGVNIYGKNLVVFSVGLSVAALVYYQQFDEDDDNVTSNPPEGSQPHKVDFCGWASLDFIIHKNFMIGGKFSYSLIKFRGPRLPGISAVNGEYNNDLSLRLSYIIPTVKKSKKVMSN